jgi:hypothetical protein
MKQWKHKMIATVRSTWEQEYQDNAPKAPEPPPKLQFLDRYRRKGQDDITSDIFTSYIKGDTIEFASDTDIDLLGWWAKPTNKYLPLRQMALDLLSIPAMSAEVERVFSSAKRLVTADRNRLSDESIEVLELLKYWWDHEVIPQGRRPMVSATPATELQDLGIS